MDLEKKWRQQPRQVARLLNRGRVCSIVV